MAEADIEDSSLNRNRIIIAIVAVIVLAAVGVAMLGETEPPAPTSAEVGLPAKVDLPKEPAAQSPRPAQSPQPEP